MLELTGSSQPAGGGEFLRPLIGLNMKEIGNKVASLSQHSFRRKVLPTLRPLCNGLGPSNLRFQESRDIVLMIFGRKNRNKREMKA